MMREELTFTYEGIEAGVTVQQPDKAAVEAQRTGKDDVLAPPTQKSANSVFDVTKASRSSAEDQDPGSENNQPLAGVAVLYLHGGGLLYGERDDLPAPYVKLFLEQGATLVCADYPLAPETPLAGIQAFLDALWSWVANNLAPKFGCRHVFLFGRSAGAYLALTLAARLSQQDGTIQPAGVIDFYGYGDMAEPELTCPCKTYLAFPKVSPQTVHGLISDTPICSGSKATRYALYVYARQQGAWKELLDLDENGDPFAIIDEQTTTMPPVFYAASTGDGDVPYTVSKRLARRLHARMDTVYGLPHDFDRDTANPAGKQAYEKCLAWMDQVVKAANR